MDLAPFLIDPRRLWPGEGRIDSPLLFVDLDTVAEVPEVLALPSCPVIGIGSQASPLAPLLDAVVEPPVNAEALARQILARPRAAAVIAQLLRVLPSLAAKEALTVESLAYATLQGSEEHREWIASLPSAGTEPLGAGSVRLERDGGHLVITLDDPQNGNAIDRTMRDQLFEAFQLAALDPEIDWISLRGAGRTFSLGARLDEFGTTTDPATAHAIRQQTLPAHMAALCADRLDVHVQGGCVGSGLELAAWAGRITATSDAWFQLPELAMGILPGAGGCVSLTRRIGRQRTALMVLSGRRLSARHALDWWLVDAIVDEPPGD